MTDSQTVDNVMKALEATYMQLRRHPFVAQGERSPEAVAEFETMLHRASPVTSEERIVHATIRWLTQHNRGAFIEFVKAARLRSIGLAADGHMAEVALGISGSVALKPSANGLRVSEPRSPSSQTPRRGRRNPGGGKRRRRTRSDNRPVASDVPVLSEATHMELKSRLQDLAASPSPLAVAPFEAKAIDLPAEMPGASAGAGTAPAGNAPPNTPAGATPETTENVETGGHWADA